jgi:hypothetical protein
VNEVPRYMASTIAGLAKASSRSGATRAPVTVDPSKINIKRESEFEKDKKLGNKNLSPDKKKAEDV